MKVLHQQRIKEINLKMIASMVAEEREISRAKIARVTKLSKTTVSALVDILINDGYVVDEGTKATTKQGRKPNKLKINCEDIAVVSISWKTNYVEAALVDLEGGVIDYDNVISDKIDYLANTVELYNRLVSRQKKQKKIMAMCVIVPGSIDDKKILTTVIPIVKSDTLIEDLRKEIPKIPLAFFNDTACIAYVENHLSNMKKESYIYVNMNKGIGAVLFHEGKILRGADGMTTQFGHFSIDRDGDVCECGNRGCLEKEIGEAVLGKLAKKAGFDGETRLSYNEIGRKADLGEAKYKKIVDLMAKDFAFALSNMLTIYNVPKIIIGGEGPSLGKEFLKLVREYIRKDGFRRFTDHVIIEYSDFSLGNKTDLSGAAKYYINTHHSFLGDNENKLFLW